MDGILVVNKPLNYTSHDIVYKIKKITNEKVGHTGTLDPMASGVLPLLIGKGTLCSKYLINHDKIYDVELTLGKKTDTADSEGKVLQEEKVDTNILEKTNIENILKSFLGISKQVPPIYSAIKINGKKLYEYARKGQEVEIEPREIQIYDIKLTTLDVENMKIKYQVKCSKGTYIRSLCEDIAKKLGTIGYMSALNRVQVGNFNIRDSVNMKEIEENNDIIKEKLITIEDLFKNKPQIILDKRKLKLFLNGVKLTFNNEAQIYRIYCENNFIGIGEVKNNLLKREIIL